MRTAVIRVLEPPAAGSAYPVKLFTDSGSDTWLDEPIAEASMPADLADPDPPTDAAGQALAWDGIVPFMLGKEGARETYLAIGKYLLRQIAPGAVGTALEALRHDLTTPTGDGLRTYLDLRPASIRKLPWELSADSNGRLLFIDDENPWVRGSPPFPDPPQPDPGPLRVLIVIGSRDQDVAGEEEVAAVLPILRAVNGVAEVLRAPSQSELVNAYRDLRPHVFHFIGHGVMLAGSGAVLQLGSGPTAWTLSDQEILNILPGWTGRLAILNACRTADGPATDSHEASANLVEAFRTRGFRAVVGMQADIRSTAAAALSSPFYKALGNGSPLDQALAGARNTIARPGLGSRDWALPALTLDTDPAQVIVLDEPAPRISLEASEFNESRAFVGQGPERRSLWMGLDPELFEGKAHGLTLVAGAKENGKTWLIFQVLWICALRGRSVRYVKLNPRPNESLDFLEVLRRIRDGGEDGSPLQGPLPSEAFDRFNHQVNFLARGKEPSPLEPPKTPVRDQGKPFKAGLEFGRERIYEGFAAALKAAAGAEPLVIALDQAEGVATDARATLWNNFLMLATDGRLGNVRLIVGIQGNDLGDWLTGAPAYPRTIHVDEIAIEDFVPLALEYFNHRGRLSANLPMLLDVFAQQLPVTWLPNQLEMLFGALRLPPR